MPRITALRVSSLEEFALQQRFTPDRALRRQVERAEALAREIDPARNYPEDWLIFRLTGYRPDIDSPAVLVGAALLSDLSALVERLSDLAAYRVSELEANSWSAADLARRWSVSRKSLERYRRLGLPARRARSERGRVVLRFMRHAVAHFESRHHQMLERARGFSRLSQDEAREAQRRVSALTRRAGLSLAAASRRVAARTDRSAEGLRRAVMRLDRGAEEPAIARTARLTPAQRRECFDLWNSGLATRAIAAQMKRPAASIHRAIVCQRYALLHSLASPLPLSSHTRAPEEWRAHLITDRAGEPIVGPTPITVKEFLEDARSGRPPTAARELELSRAYHALRLMAAAAIHEQDRTTPSARALDVIEDQLRRAARLKIELARGQTGLVLRSIEERAARPFEELAPRDMVRAHSAAYAAVAVAIDRHDPFRRGGGRLAAPASLELGRALSGLEFSPPNQGAARKPIASIMLEDWTAAISPKLPRSR